ncbi:MAG: lactate utilization protein [Deltaproteobacteria bacterium]|nr:lactate utilization protein [Deltaproteobacteria bacterium]
MAAQTRQEEAHLLALRMKTRAEAAQIRVSEAANTGDAFRYTIDLVKHRGGSTIAAPSLPAPAEAHFRKLCGSEGLTLLTGNLRSHMNRIHTAFTVADWGISETGTIVLDSSSEDVRIATTLCEIHVAALRRSRIRPDAYSLEEDLDRLMKRPPRFLAFISGASRTADIERVLTIGVHGPLEVHLLIMDDEDDA